MTAAADDAGGDRKSVGRMKLFGLSSVLMAARIGGAIIGLSVQLFLVRWLDTAQYGIYVMAIALAGVLSIVCTFGFPSITARFAAHYAENDQRPLIAGFIRSTRRHLFAVAATVIAIAAMLLFATGDLVPEAYRWPLLIGCLVAPLVGFMRLNGALANVRRRYLLSYLPDLIVRPILFIGAVLVLISVAPRPAVETVLALHLATVAAVSFGLYALLKPMRSFGVQKTTPQFDNGAWRRAGFPMVFVVVMTAFLADFDVLIIGMLLPADQVAVFSICLRMMLFVEFGVQAVFQIVTPDLAEAHARNDRNGLKRAIGRAGQMNLLFVAVAIIGAYGVGEFALGLFGAAFVSGWPVLMVLITAQLARALFGPVTQILTIAGRQMDNLTIYLVVGAVMIAANVVVVPAYGLIGAASVFSAAVAIGAALQAWRIHAVLGVLPLPVVSGATDRTGIAVSPAADGRKGP